MSVAVPVIDYIDGSARRIYLLAGVDAFHWIEDVYREYVDLRANDEALRKWKPFMNAKGNEAKGGGKYTPRYVTLLDDCRVIPFDENILITVTGEAITDNADVDSDPFDTTTRVNPLKLYITPPAAEIVRDEVSLAAIAQMSFNNEVWHDHERGYTLEEHIALGNDPTLLGNSQYPASDHAEALAIANSKLITKLRYTGPHNLVDLADLEGLRIHGDSAINDSLILGSAPDVSKVELANLTIMGVLDGSATVRDCLINGLSYFNGILHQCALLEPSVLLGGGSLATAMYLDCYSGVAGGNARPCIDFNHTETNLAVRGWQGGIELINKSQSTGEVSIDLSSGTVYIRESCTAGAITLRGLGKCVDESGPGCAIHREGLLDPSVSQASTFNGYIHVSIGSEYSGTEFPVGNEQYHVNNLADAKTIAENYGIPKIMLHTNATISDIDLTGYAIKGINASQTTIVLDTTAILDNTVITDTTVTGILDSNAIIRESVVHGLSFVNGFIHQCAITSQGIKLGGTNPCLIMDCYSLPTTTSPTIFDCNNADTPLIIRGFKGGSIIKNRTTNTVTSAIYEGSLNIDPSCTDGTFNVSGIGTFNNKSNLTIDETKIITQGGIAQAVWSYTR